MDYLVGIAILLGILVAWQAGKWLGGDIWRVESIFGVPVSIQHVPPFKWALFTDLRLKVFRHIAARNIKYLFLVILTKRIRSRDDNLFCFADSHSDQRLIDLCEK